MGDPDPKVVRGFERELQIATEALNSLKKKCAEAQEDYSDTHSQTISEAIKESRFGKGAGLSSVSSTPKPVSKFAEPERKHWTASSAMELGQLPVIEARKKKCDEMIAELEK